MIRIKDKVRHKDRVKNLTYGLMEVFKVSGDFATCRYGNFQDFQTKVFPINDLKRIVRQMVELNGIEEKEIENVSGQCVYFKHFNIFNQRSDNFRISYDVRLEEGHKDTRNVSFKAGVINLQGSASQKNNSLAVLEQESVFIPNGWKIYVKLDPVSSEPISDKSVLSYEIVIK